MVDLKVGDRVKVTLRPGADAGWFCGAIDMRRDKDGKTGRIASSFDKSPVQIDFGGGVLAWFEPDELTPETLPDVIRAAHAEGEVANQKREVGELHKAIDGWVARCDVLRAELATEREARQAADVLARRHGESLNRAQMGEGAARMQLSRVAAAVSVVRAAWGGMVKSEVDAALAALDRALAGVPAPVEAAVPLGDAADLAALIAKVEAHPLHNRGGVVSSALLVDVLRAVERRLVAVERRRPKVGPWTSPGMLHDAAGGTVASVWPCPGGWGWVANRPNLGPLNGTAETEDEAKAAVLAVLSTWCDVVVAPEPREP